MGRVAVSLFGDESAEGWLLSKKKKEYEPPPPDCGWRFVVESRILPGLHVCSSAS